VSYCKNGHCLTCSDEAIAVKVLSVHQGAGLALVLVSDKTEEVDTSLVEEVAPGDILLVHGGVAIGSLESHSSDDAGAPGAHSEGM